jgi:hypothetical protein
MKLRVVLGFLTLVISSCASSSDLKSDPSIPEWVLHPEMRFPLERYLSSIGVGASREEAIRDAKKNMAETFLVKVRSATQSSSESNLSKDTSGGLKGEASESLKKELNFESVARLRGAEVKDVVTVGGDVYALLALDRLSARSGLLLDANRIKSKLEAELDGLEQGYSAAKFQEARKDLEQLRELGSEASVLGMAAILPLDSLEARFIKTESGVRERNRNLRFRVSTLKGDERFARDLEVCIQDQGGTIVSGETSQEGVGQIQVSVIEQPLHLEIAGWVKVRFEVTANLIRPDGKSVRIRESKTETARSKEAGLEAAAEEISRKVCEQAWNRLGELK